MNFYPRPPRGGRHSLSPSSTPTPYFYPRPPRGGRLARRTPLHGLRPISIHALREEGDGGRCGCIRLILTFLSTPSARRATSVDSGRVFGGTHFYPRPPRGGRPPRMDEAMAPKPISIHALREEGDCECIVDIDSTTEFLSTPSARRATDRRSGSRGASLISIHALREEGDMSSR